MLPHIVGRVPDSANEPRTLYWQHETHAAIRQGKWKLITLNDRSDNPWELYDLSADRSESKDLRGQYPKVATRLRAKWKAWAERSNVVPFPEQREKAKPIPWPPRL